MSQRAAVVGRLIAAGKLDASRPVTFGDLAYLNDLAEGTAHGAAARAELENTDIATGARIGDGDDCEFSTVAEFEKKLGRKFQPILKPLVRVVEAVAAVAQAAKKKSRRR